MKLLLFKKHHSRKTYACNSEKISAFAQFILQVHLYHRKKLFKKEFKKGKVEKEDKITVLVIRKGTYNVS